MVGFVARWGFAAGAAVGGMLTAGNIGGGATGPGGATTGGPLNVAGVAGAAVGAVPTGLDEPDLPAPPTGRGESLVKTSPTYSVASLMPSVSQAESDSAANRAKTSVPRHGTRLMLIGSALGVFVGMFWSMHERRILVCG